MTMSHHLKRSWFLEENEMEGPKSTMPSIEHRAMRQRIRRTLGVAAAVSRAILEPSRRRSFEDFAARFVRAHRSGSRGRMEAHMPRRYSASSIARYFLAKQDPDADDMITHLKLQKLCYYAQGVGIATRGEAMFDEQLEAWLHGPVVPSLYREYREHGNLPIPPVVDLDEEEYDDEDRMILDDVYIYYGQFSGWRLRQMTHDEAPWKDAYMEDMNRTITPDALRMFFANEIEPGYRERYVEISRRAAH